MTRTSRRVRPGCCRNRRLECPPYRQSAHAPCPGPRLAPVPAGSYGRAQVLSKRLFPLTLALLLATSVQATQGSPLRTLAELRAAHCCSHTCRHGRTTSGAARHCCQVAQDDPGVLAGAKPAVDAPAVIAVVLDAVPAVLGAPASGVVTGTPPLPRAAPLFLLTRTLRL